MEGRRTVLPRRAGSTTESPGMLQMVAEAPRSPGAYWRFPVRPVVVLVPLPVYLRGERAGGLPKCSRRSGDG